MFHFLLLVDFFIITFHKRFFGIQIFTWISILLSAFEAKSSLYYFFKFSSAFDMFVNFKIFTIFRDSLSLLVLNEAQRFKGFWKRSFCYFILYILVWGLVWFNSSREVRVCEGISGEELLFVTDFKELDETGFLLKNLVFVAWRAQLPVLGLKLE